MESPFGFPKNAVTQEAGVGAVRGVQASADATLGEVGPMFRVVTPPSAVVVPKVVVGIFLLDADGQLSCHGVGLGFGLRMPPGFADTKKPPFRSGAVVPKDPQRHFVVRAGARTSSQVSPKQTTIRDVSSRGWHPDPPMRLQEFLMLVLK